MTAPQKTPARVADAVTAELTAAQAKFAPFNSAHEGWAVLLEEVDELEEEMEIISGRVRQMFQPVRKNDPHDAGNAARAIADAATRAAVEAIQVAAMANRFIEEIVVPDVTCPETGSIIPATSGEPQS